MSGTFDFVPESQVPITIAPDPVQGISMNGWTFTARPSIPYQRKFRVTLHGMRWLLQTNGLFDYITTPLINARRLEMFYEANGTWDKFAYNHPHFGSLTCRFSTPVAIPEAISNANGLIQAFDVELIHHDPAYA